MNRDMPLSEATYYILLALIQPNHGYGIIQQVEQMTNSRVVLGAGTLYGALNSLLKKNWIKLYSEDTSSRKKKEYVLTELGLSSLKAEVSRLKGLIENSKILEDQNDKV